MTDRLAIALAQLNPTLGALEANCALLRKARAEAAGQGADLVVASELFLTGYPPEDLVLKPAFLEATRAAAERLAEETGDGGPALLVGAPWRHEGRVYNAALLLDGGKIQSLRFKVDLPNYSVFDEKRVFAAGPLPGPVNVRGVRLGVMVCEDMWTPEVAECLEESGAEILVVPNGSPYEADKVDHRIQLAAARVTETGLPLVYVNQVGGQDELVFDGASFVLDGACALRAQLPAFEPGLVVTRWRRDPATDGWTCDEASLSPPEHGHRADLPGAHGGSARLCRQERLSRRRDRALRRHRFGAFGGRRG